jgi:hypothetical protein
MSRGAHSFKQGDVTKAIKGLVKAGATDWRVEIVKGKITLVPPAPVVIGAAPASAPDTHDEASPDTLEETSADIRKLL